MNPTKLFAFFVFLPFISFAQQNVPRGYFTSEATAVSSGDNIIVSIKKYNPTQDQINKATNPSKNSPLNYLQIPVVATNISFFSKDFESKLYCLDIAGNILWDQTIGYSKNSLPSPVTEDKGFVYTGEAKQDGDKVAFRKVDPTGKIIWNQELDSLENVNAISFHENRINALVSFEHSEKITAANGSYSFKTYPVYSFIQLDPETGRVIKKEYQLMGTYLSSIGFGDPYINSDYSYYLSNDDSAVFLDITKQKGATVVSNKLPDDTRIVALTAGPASNHYITQQSQGRNKDVYTLITDFYDKEKKYQSILPVEFYKKEASRYFVQLSNTDNIVSIITNGDETTISMTNIEGKTEVYKKVNNSAMIVAGCVLKKSTPVIIWLEGRNKPGIAGAIKISQY